MTDNSSLSNALVIYNPSSGSATDIDMCLGTIVHSLCSTYNCDVTIRPTRPDDSGSELVSVAENPDLIIVAGGDGTLRLVLGALNDAGRTTPVGIVPLGTGNQLARNLGIFEENLLGDPVDKAIEIILAGHTERVDLGKMNGHYFCVAAGVGPLSDAVLSPSPQEKANLRILAYVASVIQNVASPPVTFHIQTGNDSFEVSASGVFITNVSEFGVGTLADSASIRDGLLDLCILAPTEFTDYLSLGFHFAGAFLGAEAPYYTRKVSAVDIDVVPGAARMSELHTFAHTIRSALSGKVDAKPPVFQQVLAMIDGDACGTTPMSVQVVPHAVSIFTPAPR